MTSIATPAAPDDARRAGSAPAPLEVRSVVKRFRQGERDVRALNGVSLAVSRGQFVAIMGASGSGKSTLLHVVGGLTQASEGQVLVDGQDLSTLNDRKLTAFRRRRIGLVFQAFNLIPALTALDNVLLPTQSDPTLRHFAADAEPLLRRLGIYERRHHRPDALSGGEQQRVAIARALIARPSIVLADEPTGSLDSVTGQRTCELLRELSAEQGRTIVVVTHEPAVAIWAQRVVVLKDGQNLTEFDTAQFVDANELAAHYQTCVRRDPTTAASTGSEVSA